MRPCSEKWARLRSWIEKTREELRLAARISVAATEWIQADRNADYLLTGSRLAQADEELGKRRNPAHGGERGFVECESCSPRGGT
jgi:hypothetical protein